LKAAWTAPFPERATADAPFYPDGRDQPTLTVPMMHGTASRAYLRGDGYQAVLLPYRDINLAMAVLLPDGPLATLRPKLAAAGLGGLLAGAARHQVTLSLPRFRLEAAFNLIPALRRLGVAAAFGDNADFGEITEAAPLRRGQRLEQGDQLLLPEIPGPAERGGIEALIADTGISAEPEQAPGQVQPAVHRRDVQRGLPRVGGGHVGPAPGVHVEAERGEQ